MGIREAIRVIDAASRDAAVPVWSRKTLADGYVYIDPPAADIARAAGVPLDTLALATMVQSEVGSLPAQYLYAVAEVVLNETAARGTSVSQLLVGGGKKPGHFGGQSGRYAATSQRPTRRALEAARAAMNKMAAGFTKTSRKFFDPKVQDGGFQAGKALTFDALGIVRKWYGEGNRWIGHLGDGGEVLIDPYVLFLMNKSSNMTQADAESAVIEGRRRWTSGGSLPTLAVAGGIGALAVAGIGAWLYLR